MARHPGQKRDGHNTTALERQFNYHGLDTCAATGLCAERCPVGINTGALVTQLRSASARHTTTAQWAAEHFATVLAAARVGLRVATQAQRLLGAPRLARYAQGLHNLAPSAVARLPSALPQPVRTPRFTLAIDDSRPRVVYLAACVSRVMGPTLADTEQTPLITKTTELLEKAGFQVVFPDNLNALCCGQPFDSKGYTTQAEAQRQALTSALLQASRGGLDPVYCDTSPCTLRMRGNLADKRLDIYDPVRFIHTHLLDKLEFSPQAEPIALHTTCSTQHLGQSQALLAIAQRCSQTVVVPEGIYCCGFAGDKGFTKPELNAHALRSLRPAVAGCMEGISTSRTCEIGLSEHAGIDYHGLVYLVDRVTRPKTEQVTSANFAPK